MHLHLLTLFALVGCGGSTSETEPAEGSSAAQPPTEAPTEQAPGEWAAEGDTAKVLEALSQRKPEPRCQDVDKMTADPLKAYREIITHVEEPVLANMRAATCMLSQHPRDAEADAVAWVVDPEQASLTTLVLGRLDTLPLDSAKKIATAALGGPHAETAKVRIGRLRTPELKAMATAAP